MNQKLLSKVLATMLVMTLTLANFILLGMYTTNSYATSDELEKQGTVTNNENVEFDAYFKDEKGKITHSLGQDIHGQDMKLYLQVKVKKGYLRNAKIAILGENNTVANFKIQNSNQSLELIENIKVEANEIELKQLNQGTEIVLEIPIVANQDTKFDLSNFSKENGITLNGSYVSDEGKTVAITKTIKLRNEWTATANAKVEQIIQRYIPYELNGNKGIILQTVVKTGLVDNNLPIKQTNNQITVPVINGVKPSKVNVTANHTLATNGQQGVKFSQDNWSYDEQKGIIDITVKNEAQDNQVAWEKNVQDEYVITYIFPQEAITDGGIQTSQEVTTQIEVYNSVETKVQAQTQGTIQLHEKMGEMVSSELVSMQDGLSKGYLYTKSERETQYHIKSVTDIGYADVIDQLQIESGVDNFIGENGEMYATKVSNTNYAYYQSTTINKENFIKLFGEQGRISIKDQDGATLTTFNHESEVDENGNFVYQYVAETNKVTIQTSKPISEGKLEIEHVKSLKGKTDYSKTQVTNFKTLQTKTITKVISQDTVLGIVESGADITLVDPSTKIEVGTNTDTLSTVVKNENVQIKVILKTNDLTCDLYKNPTLEIVLPSYVQDVTIKDINLLFDEELQISGYEVTTNSEGNKVITVTLKGEDTKYNQDEISKGANLVISTDITLKQLTPTKEDVMRVYVTNQNATTYENTQSTRVRSLTQKGYTETVLKAVAPVGIVTTNTMEGYNSKADSITSISGQVGVGKLEAKKEARVATLKMSVINNYQNKINNVSILGRIPFAGNKDVGTAEDFNSNITATLNSAITSSGVDASKVIIYYSENAEATNDLANSENAWSTTMGDSSKVKSYLIVLKDYEMNTGDTLNFTYQAGIPENLSYNTQTYSNYAVYFDNVAEDGTTKEKAVATKVGAQTGEGPSLEVSMSASPESGAEVEEGKVITYTVNVKNTGKTTAKNVKVSGNIPDGAIYTYRTGEAGTQETVEQKYDGTKKVYEEVIANIEPGETKTIRYQVEAQQLVVGKDENGNEIIKEKELVAKATASVEGYEASFTSNEIKNKVVQGYLNYGISIVPIDNTVPRKENDKLTYKITIKNVNSKAKQDVVVTDVIPEGIEVTNAGEGTYNQSNRTVTWNLGTIAGNAKKTLFLEVIVTELPEGIFEKTVENKIQLVTPEKQLDAEIAFKVQKAKLSIAQTSETKSTVKAGETITYNIIIKNEGAGNASNIKITDLLPEGVEYKESQYSINGETNNFTTSSRQLVLNIATLKPAEQIELTIKVTAGKLQDVEKLEISNVAKVKATNIEEITSNEIKHTITASSDANDDPSVDEPEEGTYTISGIAWLDTNKDGRRDDNEQRLPRIPVILINSETGEIVKDITTGNAKKQETTANGEYVFANLKPGKYMVVFLYDAGNYEATDYQKAGVNNDKNSDAVQMSITMDGKTRLAGVSNTIEIGTQDITNIDIGLIVSPKFDLSLDKVITKISVTDKKGTVTHEYKDSKLAKVDLDPKTVNDSMIMIEYKIRVINEGGVAGYAKKIVDYLPKDMKFSSELNQDWYASENGNIYNASLANTLIQPGETKELTLLLTKKMTENNTGNINNNAEIQESYNDLGLSDIDSTPANKVQSEDDISSADAIIGIRTGEVYIYITLTITMITILGVGIYLINKKVLRKV